MQPRAVHRAERHQYRDMGKRGSAPAYSSTSMIVMSSSVTRPR